MWNNIPPANTKMNKFECLMVHKGHLERLAQARKVINTKKPKIPSFLLKGIRNQGIAKEREMKIQYENRVLFNRMYEINKHFSPYSKNLNIPSHCPAYELLSYHRLKKNRIIKVENNKLYKRFNFSKPTLTADKLNQEYEYNQYLESNISQNKNRVNPNLAFVDYEKFNKRIKNINSASTKHNRKIMINLDKSLQNSKNILDNINSKSELMPSLTNYNYKQNMEWISNITDNEPIINNNIDFKERIKQKRPHSSKPTAIVINREFINDSKVFNSEQLGNNSNKLNRNKPASGKTRTNGSYSTNIMTST
jgi:hypothetical protein